jgi:hypothetical protein
MGGGERGDMRCIKHNTNAYKTGMLINMGRGNEM